MDKMVSICKRTVFTKMSRVDILGLITNIFIVFPLIHYNEGTFN